VLLSCDWQGKLPTADRGSGSGDFAPCLAGPALFP